MTENETNPVCPTCGCTDCLEAEVKLRNGRMFQYREFRCEAAFLFDEDQAITVNVCRATLRSSGRYIFSMYHSDVPGEHRRPN